LVQNCKVNVAPLAGGRVNAAALVGHVKLMFPAEVVMVGCGGKGNEML
jgi:hypothetical protein